MTGPGGGERPLSHSAPAHDGPRSRTRRVNPSRIFTTAASGHVRSDALNSVPLSGAELAAQRAALEDLHVLSPAVDDDGEEKQESEQAAPE